MKIEIYVNIDKKGYGFCSLRTPFQNNDPYITDGYRLFKIVAELPMTIMENVDIENMEEITDENKTKKQAYQDLRDT